MNTFDRFLRVMSERDASDLHLKTGEPPVYRIRGALERDATTPPLDRETLAQVLTEVLSEEQTALFATQTQVEFGYGDPTTDRFRCTFFRDQRGYAAAIRRLAGKVPPLDELNLPTTLENFVHARGGMVLVTGATGSGKTTTMAALIDLINTNFRRHIITLEDPIEYIHESKKSLVHQRGLHYDITDFASGIKAAVREAPDVLLIGEMRDTETIRMALSAAELGVLVFSTLHTNGAVSSVDRMIDVFPADEQGQARAMLGNSLLGVVSQVLLRRIDRRGRVPATELLLSSPAVSALIRENKSHELTTVIQTGGSRGMHLLDDSLLSLMERRMVDPEEALSFVQNRPRFQKLYPNARL